MDTLTHLVIVISIIHPGPHRQIQKVELHVKDRQNRPAVSISLDAIAQSWNFGLETYTDLLYSVYLGCFLVDDAAGHQSISHFRTLHVRDPQQKHIGITPDPPLDGSRTFSCGSSCPSAPGSTGHSNVEASRMWLRKGGESHVMASSR